MTKTDNRTSVTSNHTYDAIYELTQVTQGSTTTESYTYDPVGNRTASLGMPSYTTNTSNELTAKSGGVSYTYDNNGNSISKTDPTGTTNYTWDYENRLTSVTLPGSGGTVSFKYDPFDRRVYKSSGAGTSIYAFDVANLIEETNSSGTFAARYVQGENIDEPIATLRSSATSYYEQDGLGTITSLSSTAGALAQTYSFDSFGKQTAASGSLTNPFQFTGRELDAESNLYYMRARYLDPMTGRFISEDPLMFDGGVNFFSYVSNSPVRYVDPFGTCIIEMYVVRTGKNNDGTFYHSFLSFFDNSSNRGTYPITTIIRGGPGPGTPPVLEGNKFPLNRTSIDQPSDALYSKTLISDSCRCAPYVGKAEDVIRRLQNKPIAYGKPTDWGVATSNSVTYTAIQDLGIKPPKLPVDVRKFLIGWGVYIKP